MVEPIMVMRLSRHPVPPAARARLHFSKAQGMARCLLGLVKPKAELVRREGGDAIRRRLCGSEAERARFAPSSQDRSQP